MSIRPDNPTSRSTPPEILSYSARPALQNAATVGLQSGIIGTFVSAVQNALGSHSHGAAGIVTRTGGTIGFFAAMGATFAFTESVVANQREKEDAVNGAAGGCAAGFLAGIRSRSLPMAIVSCAIIGAAMGTFDYAGQLAGEKNESKAERRKKFFKHQPLMDATDGTTL